MQLEVKEIWIRGFFGLLGHHLALGTTCQFSQSDCKVGNPSDCVSMLKNVLIWFFSVLFLGYILQAGLMNSI